MNRIMKSAVCLVLGGFLLTGLSSFTGEDESGGGNCNLCKVEGFKKILGVWVGETIFSCKAAANQSCSKSGTKVDKDGKSQEFSISCNNAVAC